MNTEKTPPVPSPFINTAIQNHTHILSLIPTLSILVLPSPSFPLTNNQPTNQQAFEARLDKYWSALRETPVKSTPPVKSSGTDDDVNLTGTLVDGLIQAEPVNDGGDNDHDGNGGVPSQPLTRLSHNVLVDAQQRVTTCHLSYMSCHMSCIIYHMS